MALKDISLAEAVRLKEEAERQIGIAVANSIAGLYVSTGLTVEGIDIQLAPVRSLSGSEFPTVVNVKVSLAKPW